MTLNQIDTALKKEGLEFKTPRNDGVLPIRKINGKIIAAYHPITRRFWIKDPSKNGRNANFRTLTEQIMSFNELSLSAERALVLNE